MRIVITPRAIGLRLDIDAEQEIRDLGPVGVFGRGIEQAQVELSVAVIVVGQMVRRRPAIGAACWRYFFFLPLAWARSDPATVFSDLLDELLFSSFDAVEAGFFPVVIAMNS